MSSRLRNLINSAQKLSPPEQIALIQAVTELLQQHYHQPALAEDFWSGKPIGSPTVPVVRDLSSLRADFWPEDESADEFLAYVYQQRAEDRSGDE